MWNSLLRVVPSWALSLPKDGDSHPCLGHCSHVGTPSWWEIYLYLTRIPLTGITAFTSNPFAVHLGDESGFSFFYDLHWVSEGRNKTNPALLLSQECWPCQGSPCVPRAPTLVPCSGLPQSPQNLSCTGQTGHNSPEATAQSKGDKRSAEDNYWQLLTSSVPTSWLSYLW